MCFQTSKNKYELTRLDAYCIGGIFILVALLYIPQFFSGLSAIDTPENMDITSQWFPAYTIVAKSYKEGFFPLWNPHNYSGIPWLAYSHTGALYIPNIFLFCLFNFFDAVTLSYFFHTLLCSFFLFFFLRAITLSSIASFLSSVVFSCSGFYFCMQSQLSNHSTISWLLPFLYVLFIFHNKPQLKSFIILSFITTMMVYAGDTEGFFYIIIYIFFFIFLVLSKMSSGSTLRTLFLTAFSVGLCLFMSSAVLFVLGELTFHSVRSRESLFQLEFSGIFENYYKYIPLFFFPLKYYQGLHPLTDFNNGFPPFYSGILTITGAIYSLRHYRNNNYIRAFWQIAFVVAVFLFIKESELFESLVKHIPLFGQLATPERSFELIQLSTVSATAFGFDSLLNNLNKKSITPIFVFFIILGFVLLAIAPFLVSTSSRYFLAILLISSGVSGLVLRARLKNLNSVVLSFIVTLVLLDVYVLAFLSVPRNSPSLFELEHRLASFLKGSDHNFRFITFEELGPNAKEGELSGIIVAKSGLDTPYGHMRLPLHKYFEFLYLIDQNIVRDWDQIFYKSSSRKKFFFTIDLFNPSYLSDRNLKLLNLLSVKYVFSRGLSFKFSSPYSLMNEQWLAKGNWFVFPQRVGKKVELLRCSDERLCLEVFLPYQVEFESYIYKGTKFAFELKIPESEPVPADIAIKLLLKGSGSEEMKLIFSKEVENSERPTREFSFLVPLDQFEGRIMKFRLELYSRSARKAFLIDARMIKNDAPFQRIVSGPIDIFFNKHAFPRVFLLHNVLLASPEEIRTLLREKTDLDLRKTILLEKGQVPQKLVSLVNSQPHFFVEREFASIAHYGAEKVRIDARLFSAGFLFMSDVYYPGWRVFVNGVEERLYRANYTFRAVFLPEGFHSVRFEYQPFSFRIGLWLSISSIFCSLGVCVAFILGKMNRKNLEKGGDDYAKRR